MRCRNEISVATQSNDPRITSSCMCLIVVNSSKSQSQERMPLRSLKWSVDIHVNERLVYIVLTVAESTGSNIVKEDNISVDRVLSSDSKHKEKLNTPIKSTSEIIIPDNNDNGQ
jgi:hypothetical protein